MAATVSRSVAPFSAYFKRDVPEEERPAVDGMRQASRVISLELQFGERNPGMVRVMVGDAIVFEHERLQARMNQFFDRIESTLRQCLRPAAGALGSSAPTVDAQVAASVLTSFALGRLQRLFVVFVFAFGHRPRTLILVGPIGPAGMREQQTHEVFAGVTGSANNGDGYFLVHGIRLGQRQKQKPRGR